MGIRDIDNSDLLQSGPEVIASAASISPRRDFVRITGNTTIDTINLPNPLFRGPLFIMNTDAGVGAISTNGNFLLGLTLTRYKVFTLLYDPTTSKWYPSAIS